ncbi:type II secretion system protein [Photobacterium nomapromontoriensis]|uniref:type II secretion system protein n=1 Tax=Photobacterium nomapromontoriensis TaxID=2910237 RepID=UPI003D0F5A9B
MKRNGFTLIELVVVIVILGILAVTVAPRFLGIQSDAKIAVLEATEGAMESAFSLFAAKTELPSADIVQDGNGRYMIVNDVHIRIDEYDHYPWFSYFALGKDHVVIEALKALMNIDVYPLDDNNKGSHHLNIEGDVDGGFFVFPQIDNFYGQGDIPQCYLKYTPADERHPKSEFALKLTEC